MENKAEGFIILSVCHNLIASKSHFEVTRLVKFARLCSNKTVHKK